MIRCFQVSVCLLCVIYCKVGCIHDCVFWYDHIPYNLLHLVRLQSILTSLSQPPLLKAFLLLGFLSLQLCAWSLKNASAFITFILVLWFQCWFNVSTSVHHKDRMYLNGRSASKTTSSACAHFCPHFWLVVMAYLFFRMATQILYIPNKIYILNLTLTS